MINSEKCCCSCEELAQIEEGEHNCKKCEDYFAKQHAYYKPIYDGEATGKKAIDIEQEILDNPKLILRRGL